MNSPPSLLGEIVPTPVHFLPSLSRKYGVNLFAKRDDAMPFFLGGNKARRMLYLLKDAELNRCDALVTAGGVQSNHARVTSLAAASMGWESSLVLHEDDNDRFVAEGNLLIMKLSGSRIVRAAKQKVGFVMDEEMDALRKKGKNPYYIHGGGHSPVGTFAYFEAIRELHGQLGNKMTPDIIILASGTGTTQAGMHAGCHKWLPKTKVVGVSVARPQKRGASEIQEAITALSSLMGEKYSTEIDFRDNWLFGGYEKHNSKVDDVIEEAARLDGLVLDPTYTAKALLGLIDMIKSGEISKKMNIVFWHTGGLLNLLSSKDLINRPVI